MYRPHDITTVLQRQPIAWNLLVGDDAFRIQQVKLQLRQQLQKHGYTERVVLFHGEEKFIEKFVAALQMGSLFASKKIVEVHFNGDKVDQKFVKVFMKLSQRQAALAHATVVIFSAAAFSKKTTQQAWVRWIDTQAMCMQFYPMKGPEYFRWVQQRSSSYGVTLQNAALQTLVEYTQGNPLSADQQLHALSLSTQGVVDIQQLLGSIEENTRFNQFSFSDAIFVGNAKECLRILRYLQQAHVSEGQILSSVLRIVAVLAVARRSNSTNIRQVLTNEGVFSMQIDKYLRLLQRFSPKQIDSLVVMMTRLDQTMRGWHAKTVRLPSPSFNKPTVDFWQSLEAIVLALCLQRSPALQSLL